MSQNRRRAVAFVAALLVCSVGAADARADAPKRVGVLVAVTVNVTPAEATAAATALSDTLKRELVVDVVTGTDATSKLPGGRLTDVCFAQPACMRDVGRRLGVDHLVVLAIIRVGAKLKLDPTIVVVATGDAAQRPAILVDKGQTYPQSFKGVGRMLLPSARIAAEPATPPPPPGPAKATPHPPPPVVINRDTTRRRHMTRGAWIAAGIGTVALLGGTAFGWSAVSGERDLTDRGCNAMQCDQSDLDRVDRHALYADLLLGAGLAAAATTAVIYLRSGATMPPVRASATSDRIMLTTGGSF